MLLTVLTEPFPDVATSTQIALSERLVTTRLRYKPILSGLLAYTRRFATGADIAYFIPRNLGP